MGIFLFANDAQTAISSPVLSTDTVINVASGTGVYFPAPATNQQIALTIISATNPLIREIVYCTSISGDALTVVRAQESTVAWAWNLGDYIENIFTAGSCGSFLQAYGLANGLYGYPVSNLVGGSYGSLPYQSAPNVTSFLSPISGGGSLSLIAGFPAWFPDHGTVRPTTYPQGKSFFDDVLGFPVWARTISPIVWVDALGAIA